MDDQDKDDVVDTGIIDAYFVQITKLLEEVSQLQQDAKGTMRHRFQPSWMQRVLSWFRRN